MLFCGKFFWVREVSYRQLQNIDGSTYSKLSKVSLTLIFKYPWCWKSVCAMMPVAPNEFTPPNTSQMNHSVAMVTDNPAMMFSRFGFSQRSYALDTTFQLTILLTRLNKPPVPAEPSMCPTLPLREATATPVEPSTPETEPISTGSPRDVPVPCAST